MARIQSTGTCRLCGGTFDKSGMTPHLKKCRKKKDAEAGAAGGAATETRMFHIVAEGRYAPVYWIHLEVPADATLNGLDWFLRRIWLECCGHLSAFEINGSWYVSHPSDWTDDKNMDEAAIGDVLGPRVRFIHKYDFGTTTDLRLRVASQYERACAEPDIRLLARNDPPLIPCSVCGKAATKVCQYCSASGEGWLCDDCAEKHECDEYALLPVVNSPRVGQCGYDGEHDQW